MADDQSVPIFDPTGKVRMIPKDQVDAALAAGGKHAVKMLDPKGTQRWVPDDQVTAAVQSGGKLTGDQPGAIARFLGSALDVNGLKDLAHPSDAVDEQMKELREHPWRAALRAAAGPAGQVAEGLYEGGKRIAGEVGESVGAAKEGNVPGAASHMVSAIPFVGPVLDKAAEQNARGDYAGEAGTLFGAVAPALGAKVGEIPLPGEYESVGTAAERFPGAVKQGVGRAKDALYPKNKSLTPPEEASQQFIKALNPPVGKDGKIPEDIESSTEEIPHVLAHGAKQGIPINGKLDLAKAGESAGKEVQAHYDDVLLQPHSGKFQSVPRSYQGEMSGNGVNQASIGQINDRINTIRRRLNAKSKPTTQDDFALESEARELTQILHKSLGEMNGMAPEDIAAVRQRAGKLRTLAEQARMSAARDSAAVASRDSGRTGAGNLMRPVDAISDAVGGGPEVTGNRILKDALDNYEPKETELPQPKPPAPPEPSSRVPAWTGPAAAAPEAPTQVPDAEAVQSQADKFKARVDANNTAAKERSSQEAARVATRSTRQAQRPPSAPAPAAPIPDADAVQSAADKFRARVDANRAAVAAREAAAAANRVTAQQEVLKAHELETASQDAAKGRSEAVDTFRDEQAANNRAAAKNEVLHSTGLDQAAEDSAADRSTAADIARTANSAADQTQRLTEGAALRETGKRRVAAAQSPEVPAAAQPPDETTPPHAGTHIFSKSAWLDANPQGDVDAAAAEAKDKYGYEVAE
jgi:hypothetical protein